MLQRTQLLLNLTEASRTGQRRSRRRGPPLRRAGLEMKGRTGRTAIPGRADTLYLPQRGTTMRSRPSPFTDPLDLARAYHIKGLFPRSKLPLLRLFIHGAGRRPPMTTRPPQFQYGRSH